MPNDMNILVVDDDEFSREITVEMIKQATWANVDSASWWMEAIAMALVTKYSHIFMDIMMDEMDGITTTNDLRQLVKDSAMQVIWLSASRDIGMISECMASGFDKFLIKPIKPEDLKALFW